MLLYHETTVLPLLLVIHANHDDRSTDKAVCLDQACWAETTV